MDCRAVAWLLAWLAFFYVPSGAGWEERRGEKREGIIPARGQSCDVLFHFTLF